MFIAFQRSETFSAIVIVEVASHKEVASISRQGFYYQWPAWRAN